MNAEESADNLAKEKASAQGRCFGGRHEGMKQVIRETEVALLNLQKPADYVEQMPPNDSECCVTP